MVLSATIDWSGLFWPTHSLSEIILRGTIVYLLLFFVFRVLNREAGTVGLADLLLVVLVADAAQNAMAAEYRSISEGATLIATLVFWNYFLDWLAFRSPTFRKWITPSPALLVRDGQLLRRNLRAEMITYEELMAHLRQQGVDDIAKVRAARLESNGKLSVIKQD